MSHYDAAVAAIGVLLLGAIAVLAAVGPRQQQRIQSAPADEEGES
ncbi:hypothetical protein [Streptomyces sp. NPDC059176]